MTSPYENPNSSYDQMRAQINAVVEALSHIKNETTDSVVSPEIEGFIDFIQHNFPTLIETRNSWDSFIVYGNPIAWYNSFQETVSTLQNFKENPVLAGDYDSVDEIYHVLDSLLNQMTNFKYIEDGGIFGPMATEAYLVEMASFIGLFLAQLLYIAMTKPTPKELNYLKTLPQYIIQRISDFKPGDSKPKIDVDPYLSPVGNIPEKNNENKSNEDELRYLKSRTILIFKKAMIFLS